VSADRPASTRRILAIAYACEPGKGSEPGAGWTWARLLAHLGETWVITRSNNREAIESALGSVPEAGRLHFLYVDVPRWLGFWKRGQRGIRLYYLLWQRAALRASRRAAEDVPFDTVWHVTFANSWLGSFGPMVGPRFVYGPVGGGIGIAWRFLPSLGPSGMTFELLRAFVRTSAKYGNPLARMSWRRAALILVQNERGREWLPRSVRSKSIVFPNAMLEDGDRRHDPSDVAPGDGRCAIYAGKLLPLKGVSLAIRAIARAPGWRLIVCGDGPDRSRLEKVARNEGVEARVEWRGWVPREEVLETMRREAQVFLFPSLHDESPLAVADAVASGLPVLCLDLSGAETVAGAAATVVSARSPSEAVDLLAQRLIMSRWPDSEVIARRARDLGIDARLSELRGLDPLGAELEEAAG
jgi:glycosyltransferase involved in cell wall biosynthesis